MLKTIWLINAVLLLVALGMAFMTSGQDASGRAILWFFPVMIALGFGGSWLLERSGSHKPAVALGLIAPVIGAAVMFGLGRSVLGARREHNGANAWTDPKLRQLARAISAGDTAATRQAAAGADLNTVGKDGTTPLTFAIRQQAALVPLLLELGADPNVRVPGIMSPLEQALHGTGPAFDALLEGGADPNAADDYGTPVVFTAIRAERPDRYRALVARGADVKLLDGKGATTLMAAVESRQWQVALDLLDRGVEGSVVASDGASVATILERLGADSAGNADYATLMRRLAGR